MKKIKNAFIILMLVVFTSSVFFSVGCTKYASQDDLKTLDEVRQAAISAEKELDKVKSERQQLEKELVVKQQDLKNAEQELEKVKNR